MTDRPLSLADEVAEALHKSLGSKVPAIPREPTRNKSRRLNRLFHAPSVACGITMKDMLARKLPKWQAKSALALSGFARYGPPSFQVKAGGMAMLRTMAMVWAGGFLVVLAGCSFQLGNSNVQVSVKMNEQAVNDTIDHVAQRLKNEMDRMGLQATMSSQGDRVRIVSTTKSGQQFIVALNRIRGPQGEQTNVHIDWEKGSDAALWGQLILVAGQVALSAK